MVVDRLITTDFGEIYFPSSKHRGGTDSSQISLDRIDRGGIELLCRGFSKCLGGARV